MFFSGDENVLVIKNCPFLVPVNEPVLVITLFCLDTGSIVFLMIGSIVERKSLGNTIVAEEQVRGELSVTFFPPFVSTGRLRPHFKGQMKPFTFQQASDAPYTQCPVFPKTY